MKIKACRNCGSRRLALTTFLSEEEYLDDYLNNVAAVLYLCGDCGEIDEPIIFYDEAEWEKFRKMKSGLLEMELDDGIIAKKKERKKI